MIDTHAHLNFHAFKNDLPEVIKRFKKEGGEYINVVGAKIDSSIKAVEIAGKYEICFAAIGIHPHHADLISDFEKTYEEFILLSQKRKVVAIGETGLDYHHYKNYPTVDKNQKKKQKELFLLHLKLAHETGLPLVIHCRMGKSSSDDAYKDLFDTISNFMKSYCLAGVFHCFEGNLQYLETALSLGFFIGFDGNITYPENRFLRELVKNTPLSKILLETDSPFLTPIPRRYSRNEPSYLKYTIQAVSEIKNENKQKVIEETSQNAKLLFNFGNPEEMF